MSDSLPPLRVGELVFDFVGALSAELFDGQAHGLSHCMRAVDVIVEYSDRDLFVEVKDPDHTEAKAEQGPSFRGS
jgi:hypothetical protein